MTHHAAGKDKRRRMCGRSHLNLADDNGVVARIVGREPHAFEMRQAALDQRRAICSPLNVQAVEIQPILGEAPTDILLFGVQHMDDEMFGLDKGIVPG